MAPWPWTFLSKSCLAGHMNGAYTYMRSKTETKKGFHMTERKKGWVCEAAFTAFALNRT